MWAVCNAATARYFIISSVLPARQGFHTLYLQVEMKGGGGTRFLPLQRWLIYRGWGHSLFATAALADLEGGGHSLFATAALADLQGGHSLFATAALADLQGGGVTCFLLLQRWLIYRGALAFCHCSVG